MKQLRLFRNIVLVFCLMSMTGYGQKQSKTFHEKFTVDDDAVIEINTSHTDIEFETWNKNEVVVEVTVTVEDATPDEAEVYFDRDAVEILGNSSKIRIATKDHNPFLTAKLAENFMGDFHFEIPHIAPIFTEIPEIEELHELAELSEIPPLPNMDKLKFDHRAYRKDGEKYLKKWQKQFEKGFDKEHQKRMEEWGKRMEEHGERYRQLAEERAERMRKRHEERAEMQEESVHHLKERAEALAHRQQAWAAENRRRMLQLRGNQMKIDSMQVLYFQNDSLGPGAPNIFYFNANGTNKNLKVKKTIKVKMPKSVKLQMNVRHGEVKLAENTKNINATLSHSSLFATVIDGDKTMVSASYSPVMVEKWNYGQLNTDYSEGVELAEVNNLTLRSNASEVSIERLVDRAIIDNTMGAVRIYSFAPGFSGMEVTSEFGEVYCKLSNTPMAIEVNASGSEVKYPAKLALYAAQDRGTTVYSGYHINDKGKRLIHIDSKYGDVTFD